MVKTDKARSSISRFAIYAIFSSGLVANAAPTAPAWSDSTTAAAAAYCMAKHPTGVMGTYTDDGYEYADATGSGGIVGAVRRNYVAGKKLANGLNQTCNQACAQAASDAYPKNSAYPKATAKALTRKIGDTIQADGIGDFASAAYSDSNHGYSGGSKGRSIAAVWGRPNNYIEGDVAQADLCCCHVVLQPED